MAHDASHQGALWRRTVLKALGATGSTGVATLLAGCSEAEEVSGGAPGTDEPGSGPGATDEPKPQADAGGSFDCSDLARGSQPFDPDGRQFEFVWDFPASFGDVEREMADSESMAGARLGHLATKQTGQWSFIFQINQMVEPRDNADMTGAFIEQQRFEEVSPIDYAGQTVRRARANLGDDYTWKLMIPGDAADEFYHVSIVLGVDGDEEYAACADTAVSVADDIMESFRPNPER